MIEQQIANGRAAPEPGDKMAEVRSWSVKSNSYRPDYAISGVTLAEAIEKNFARIARDALLPGQGTYRLVAVWAEYQPTILKGRGGVEVTIDAVVSPKAAKAAPDGAPRRAVIWVTASAADLPARHDFKIRPDA